MTFINFKLVTIVCEPVLGPRILELSQGLGATGFTTTEVKGQGNGEKSSGELPDSKLKIEIILDSESASKFMSSLAETYFENYSVIAYATEISVLRPGKFESRKI